ncbi:16258_t:CDS:2, partial [Rhizophagus irregularis]
KTSYGPTCSTEQENINVSNHVGIYDACFGCYLTKVANFHGPNGEINFPSKPKYVRQYHKDSLKRLETIEDTAVVGALAERVKEKLNILVFLNVPPKYKAHLVTAVQVNIYFIVNIDIIT